MDSSSYPEAPRDVGRVVAGRYRLVRRIGIGSSSEVYKAENLATGGTCAIKLLRREHLSLSTARTRFSREVRLLARLDHPNIVRVFDAGEDPLDQGDQTQPYFAMPVLSGDSLRTILRHRAIDPLPWREGAILVADLLRALGELHRAGILHRDLKPGNAIVTRGSDRMTLVLIDLGLATDLSDPSLHAKQRFGSPPYLAPERWRGEAADARSDLYSVGAIFYELLTGTPPFLASERADLREQHLSAPVTPPSDRAPRAQIPAEIQALALRALEKRPEDRFADAAAFLNEIEETRERLLYRLPPGYRLLPRGLRGGHASANEPSMDPPAPVAVRGRSRGRVAALAAGATLAATLFALYSALDTSLDPGPAPAGSGELAMSPLDLDADPVPAASVPTSRPADEKAAQQEVRGIRDPDPDHDDPLETSDAPIVAESTNTGETRRRAPAMSPLSRRGPATSEEAQRIVEREPVLASLRACPDIPAAIIAELEIARGRGTVAMLNRHPARDDVPWHSCARKALEALEYPASETAGRVRVRITP
jgi:serine/threonine protein kinase